MTVTRAPSAWDWHIAKLLGSSRASRLATRGLLWKSVSDSVMSVVLPSGPIRHSSETISLERSLPSPSAPDQTSQTGHLSRGLEPQHTGAKT